MKKFRVLVQGANARLVLDGQTQTLGYYTTRFVEASDEKSAAALVIDMIRKELGSVVINERDEPSVIIDEIEEVNSFGDNLVPGKGFTWYFEKNGGPAR